MALSVISFDEGCKYGLMVLENGNNKKAVKIFSKKC